MQTEAIKLIYEKYVASGRKICTDTRAIEPGVVFFCLRGPSFNGNVFAQSAIDAGASLVVMDDVAYFHTGSDKNVLVDNALETLQELAKYARRQWDFPVIGIGGSNGKTTTKELFSAVLSTSYRVHATKGNLNNHIGVPLTLLSAPADTEMAVIELGTNSPGEIEALCHISEPDYGLITNIGKEHLEGFGSLEAVAFEESQLYLFLKQNGGLAFVNAQDEWLTRMASRLNRIQSYGSDMTIHGENHRIQPGQSDPFLQIIYRGSTYETNLFGSYNFNNILAAIAVGLFFHVKIEDCLRAICAYQPDNNRSQVKVEGNIQLIADCYNANPSSMELALQSLADLKNIRKVAILGDMFELGEHSAEEHKLIAEFAASLDIDQVVFVGEDFSKAADKGALKYEKASETIGDLKEILGDGRVAVLLKASRGMKLEQLIPSIFALNKR